MACGLLYALLAAALLLAAAPPARALDPDPIRLNLENLEQEAQYWCWAAAAQQLLSRPAYGRPPRQCELVNRANQAKNIAAPDCCFRPSAPGCGDRDGDLAEVRDLLDLYGLKLETRAGPETPDGIYETLLAGRPVLVGLTLRGGQRHLYIITGLFWDAAGRPRLLVNDPARAGTADLDFEEARSAWLGTMTVR